MAISTLLVTRDDATGILVTARRLSGNFRSPKDEVCSCALWTALYWSGTLECTLTRRRRGTATAMCAQFINVNIDECRIGQKVS